MNEKCIITAAITGGDVVPSQSAYLPIRPKQIYEEALRCADAGAAIVHIHARDPRTGEPSSQLELFEEILTNIKQKSDVIICVTTGGNPSMSLQERMSVLPRFKPEMATLNMGTMNYGLHFIAESYEREKKEFKYEWEKHYLESTRDSVFKNTFLDLDYILRSMHEHQVKPECEIYDLGMIYNTSYLVREGKLRKPLQVQFVLGVLGGARADLGVLQTLKTISDQEFGGNEYSWSAVGAGYPQEFHIGALAVLMGGNVRVGMEDNLRLDKKNYAKSNAELVEKMIRIARTLDKEVATPEEARQMLGLKGKDKTNF
jgi:uncharacterized protein (DUF849 family)